MWYETQLNFNLKYCQLARAKFPTNNFVIRQSSTNSKIIYKR